MATQTPPKTPNKAPFSSNSPTPTRNRNVTIRSRTRANTQLPSTLPPFPKPERYIQLKTTHLFRTLRAKPNLPRRLVGLIDGSRLLITRKWKIFRLYTDYVDGDPNNVKYWSFVEWRKWDLVEFFAQICETYYAQVEKAERDGVVLLTSPGDAEFGKMLVAVLRLGKKGQEIVGIQEWKRPGTKMTLAATGMCGTDLEDEEDSGDEGDSENEDSEDDEDVRLEMEKVEKVKKKAKRVRWADEEEKAKSERVDEMLDVGGMRDALPEVGPEGIAGSNVRAWSRTLVWREK